MSRRDARRLLGEGVAIVVSILLAFAIDAWWDERQKRVAEREVLEALLDDFEVNRLEAEGVISVHDRSRRLFAAASSRSSAETAALPSDSVSATLTALAYPRTFDPVRATLDALISSGRLELLRSLELRRALTLFINLVEDSAEDADFLLQGSVRVWDLMVRHGGPWRESNRGLTDEDCDRPGAPASCFMDRDGRNHFPVATGATLQAVLDDPEMMGHARRYQVYSEHYVGEVRRLAEQIDGIVALLENELE